MTGVDSALELLRGQPVITLFPGPRGAVAGLRLCERDPAVAGTLVMLIW
jgi:hypothetical protein